VTTVSAPTFVGRRPLQGRCAHEEGTMDVLIDWESVPWDEGESQPGYRGKTFVRDGLEIWRGEFTEEFADEGWMIEGHVFVFHVIEGESSVRFKDGRLIRLRQGDSGVIPAGEAGAHTVELAPGERVVIVGFALA
jgi:mannose-6-phosphate isomerase-like protein (cupin superfamily)